MFKKVKKKKIPKQNKNQNRPNFPNALHQEEKKKVSLTIYFYKALFGSLTLLPRLWGQMGRLMTAAY